MKNFNWSELRVSLPLLLTRRDIGKFFGSLISPKYLANLDSEARGPKHSRIGHKVVYSREDFLEWLINRMA